MQHAFYVKMRLERWISNLPGRIPSPHDFAEFLLQWIKFTLFFSGFLMQPSTTDSLEPELFTLRDGTRLVIRPIRPDDADDLQSAFLRLSIESIYLRFLSYKKELTDEEAWHYANVDYTTRMAFVALCEENGKDIVVGVSRYALLDSAHPDTAEAAVIVGDEHQGRGIGKLLLSRLVSYARTKGFHYLRGNLQMGNDRMLTLVQRGGLPFQQRFVDGIMEVTIDLALPAGEP
jgi:RimJ/RimL family protein N-acetyltransferase